jgi:hypothetical protein
MNDARGTHVEKLLSDVELELLGGLIGRRILGLLSDAIEVRANRCLVGWVAVEMFGGNHGQYMIIESDWSDTPEAAIDYHELHVTIEARPRTVSLVEYGSGLAIGWPHSSFVVEHDQQFVCTAISVRAEREERRREGVYYDSAIILESAVGAVLGIAVHKSIRGGLEISTDPDMVDAIRERSTPRWSVGPHRS